MVDGVEDVAKKDGGAKEGARVGVGGGVNRGHRGGRLRTGLRRCQFRRMEVRVGHGRACAGVCVWVSVAEVSRIGAGVAVDGGAGMVGRKTVARSTPKRMIAA